jgi:hypothetical protein
MSNSLFETNKLITLTLSKSKILVQIKNNLESLLDMVEKKQLEDINNYLNINQDYINKIDAIDTSFNTILKTLSKDKLSIIKSLLSKETLYQELPDWSKELFISLRNQHSIMLEVLDLNNKATELIKMNVKEVKDQLIILKKTKNIKDSYSSIDSTQKGNILDIKESD